MWHVKCGNAEYSEESEGSQTVIHNSYRSDQVDSNEAVKVVKGFNIFNYKWAVAQWQWL